MTVTEEQSRNGTGPPPGPEPEPPGQAGGEQARGPGLDPRVQHGVDDGTQRMQRAFRRKKRRQARRCTRAAKKLTKANRKKDTTEGNHAKAGEKVAASEKRMDWPTVAPEWDRRSPTIALIVKVVTTLAMMVLYVGVYQSLRFSTGYTRTYAIVVGFVEGLCAVLLGMALNRHRIVSRSGRRGGPEMTLSIFLGVFMLALLGGSAAYRSIDAGPAAFVVAGVAAAALAALVTLVVFTDSPKRASFNRAQRGHNRTAKKVGNAEGEVETRRKQVAEEDDAMAQLHEQTLDDFDEIVDVVFADAADKGIATDRDLVRVPRWLGTVAEQAEAHRTATRGTP